MGTDQLSRIFAVLALIALFLGVLGFTGGLMSASAVRGRTRQLWPLLLPLPLAVAAVSTAGSLYYSEVAGYPPCELCWYQRICMYSLVPVLIVAMIRRDPRGAWYALPLAVIGLGVSLYHYQLQFRTESDSSCSLDAPCSYRWVEEFGFVTIPFMAGCGFVAVVGLAVLLLRSAQDQPRSRSWQDQHRSPDISEAR